MSAPILQTPRLKLREWIESDIASFAKLNSDPEVMKYFPKLLSTEESQQFVERANKNLREKKFGLWAVEIKSSSEFIGFVGLANPTFEAPFMPCTEIGWRLAKQFWNKGYATEGALRVLQFAFEDLKLNEILSFTSELNKPSMRVMEKIGMQRDRTADFDHPRIEKGHPLARHVLYRMKRPN